jgi:hypothetical protein
MRRLHYVGSRTHGRGPFLCLSKEKDPKERTPGWRADPARRRLEPGATKGTSMCLCCRAASCRAPSGGSGSRHRCSGAPYGAKNAHSQFLNYSNSRLPRRAPQLSAGITRRGDSWMNRGDQGTGVPLIASRRKREAEETSGNRVAFSLDTFFWPSKRKYPDRGFGNPHSKQPSRQRLLIDSVGQDNNSAVCRERCRLSQPITG